MCTNFGEKMDTKVYQQGDRVVESTYGKESFERLKTLHLLAKKKDRKVYDFFKKNAMNTDHYMEFRKTAATADYSDTIRTESYVVIYVLNRNSSFSYFVIGVDDTTNKLFCHRLPSAGRHWLNTDQKVKDAMGFETECLEVGKTIRIQGDVTMKIERQTDMPEELLDSRISNELDHRISSRLREMDWGDMDKDYDKLNQIAVCASISRFHERDYEVVRNGLELRNMLLEREELEKSRGTEKYWPCLHKMARELQFRTKYQKECEFLAKHKEHIKQQIYDRLTTNEGKYVFKQGHHTITITAAAETERWPRGMRRESTTHFYLLRPSVITIEHKEHGKREIMISKPSELHFGILNRYQDIVQDNEAALSRARMQIDMIGSERRSLDRQVMEIESRMVELEGRNLR